MRTIIAATLIFIFWFLLSGHTETLLIVLGLISTALVVYLANRMKVIDDESYPIHLSLKLLRYFIYLGKEILLANLDVIKRILKPGLSISPTLSKLPVEMKTNLGKVIYANSITLTPGTVTVKLGKEAIHVHSLSKDAVEDLQKGHMAAAVPECEGDNS